MSHSKQYPGKYVGEVISVADPAKRCRIKVNVYDVFDGVPVDALPWATFVLPMGSRAGEGSLNPLQVGDKVWVEFVGGDSRRPLVVGCAHGTPGGTVNLPPELSQGGGQYQHKRTPDQPTPPPAEYYKDVVFCQNRTLVQLCRSGHTRITQMDSGSAVEITPEGHMILHCEGDMFVSVRGNALEEYDGNLEQRIKGDLKQTVEGTMQQSSKGDASYGSSQGGLNLEAAHQGTLTGNGGLALNGPSTFRDEVRCQKSLHAVGNLTTDGQNSNHHTH